MSSKTKAWLIISPIILITLFFLFAYNANYSNGSRSGTVIKVSKKGFIFKTLEGQLNLESFGALKSANSFAETFSFSIEKGNTALEKKLEEVSLSGERINLLYNEKYIKLAWRGDTKFFVYDIQRSNQNKEKTSDKKPF